jgi:hypothetical protein
MNGLQRIYRATRSSLALLLPLAAAILTITIARYTLVLPTDCAANNKSAFTDASDEKVNALRGNPMICPDQGIMKALFDAARRRMLTQFNGSDAVASAQATAREAERQSRVAKAKLDRVTAEQSASTAEHNAVKDEKPAVVPAPSVVPPHKPATTQVAVQGRPRRHDRRGRHREHAALIEGGVQVADLGQKGRL